MKDQTAKPTMTEKEKQERAARFVDTDMSFITVTPAKSSEKGSKEESQGNSRNL